MTVATTPRTLVVRSGRPRSPRPDGRVDTAAIDKLAGEVAQARRAGHRVVVVTSGAIAAGWTSLSEGRPRPATSPPSRRWRRWASTCSCGSGATPSAAHGLTAGQVLLAPLDFVHRSQYLHARQTLGRLLELGVVPVVNENDAVADEEIRFGDNDRLAALVAHLVGAGLLVLLTDTAGLLTGDPRREAETSLIEEVVEIDHELEAIAGGPGSAVGSGGMGSKLAAAKIAVWSGIEAVIADAARPGRARVGGRGHPRGGHGFRPREVGAPGPEAVDRLRHRCLGARSPWTTAPDERWSSGAGRSCRPGSSRSTGDFGVDDAVEIVGPDGAVFAKGLVRHAAGSLAGWAGLQSDELPEDVSAEVVHRDDLVVLG